MRVREASSTTTTFATRTDKETNEEDKENKVMGKEDHNSNNNQTDDDAWLEADDLWCQSVLLESLLSSRSSSSLACIEEALEVVKSHVLSAVRVELEEMRLKIEQLQSTLTRLETENAFLRSHVKPAIIGQWEQRRTHY